MQLLPLIWKPCMVLSFFQSTHMLHCLPPPTPPTPKKEGGKKKVFKNSKTSHCWMSNWMQLLPLIWKTCMVLSLFESTHMLHPLPPRERERERERKRERERESRNALKMTEMLFTTFKCENNHLRAPPHPPAPLFFTSWLISLHEGQGHFMLWSRWLA